MHKRLKTIHFPLVFSILALTAIGILFIYSASSDMAGHFEVKQAFWAGMGMILLTAIFFIGYRSFLNVSYLLYVIALVLLVFVFFFGQKHLGAQRWLSFGPFVFQPSEFAKIATMLALVHWLGNYSPWEGQFKPILGAAVLTLIPFVMVLKQPDLGSALLFIPIALIILFMWGIKIRYVVGSLIVGVLTMPLMWHFLKDYQKKRILVFLSPERDPLGAGYTAVQSKIAVGSGGLLGKGYLQGTQSQLHFVPEHHTDFIFCVIGEEWGFFGSLLVISLYAVMFFSIFQVIQKTTDLTAKLLCGGVLALIFAHVMINIGMTFGWMPITGLTLPLVSYGGSSFLINCFALGLVLAIYKEKSIF